MDTKKAQEYMSKADMIVQFIKTGEIEDPNLLNDEDAELSDVLDDVLNNYPEDIQTDIFNRILDDEDEEKVEYIKEFIEENMEDVPFDIARDFAIDGSESAIKRMMEAIWQAEISFTDDPILFCEIRDAKSLYDWDLDGEIYEYLDSDNPDSDFLDYIAEKYPSFEVARAYQRKGDLQKALKACVDAEDDFVINLSYEKESEWFIEVLQEALETNDEETKEIIKNINLDEDEKEQFFNICSEKNPNLATILRELWKKKENSAEQKMGDHPQQEQEKVDEQPSKKPEVESNDANALFALYQEKGGIKNLRMAAILGHAEAQYQLGLHLLDLYQSTPFWKKAIQIVKRKTTNKDKAMAWFKNAAKQGHTDAQRMLKE